MLVCQAGDQAQARSVPVLGLCQAVKEISKTTRAKEKLRLKKKEEWILKRAEDCTNHILCKWMRKHFESHKEKEISKPSGCKTVSQFYREEADKFIAEVEEISKEIKKTDKKICTI